MAALLSLAGLPESFARTRSGLHRVAEELVASARKPDNEIALTATPGGFGTPPFQWDGVTQQVRVDGFELVRERDGEAQRVTLTSVADAAPLLASLLGDPLPSDSQPLELDPEAAQRLAELYEFGASVLERFQRDLSADDAPSQINLWPEHFDIAFEAGDEAAGRRANIGVSPGDKDHTEPYLYVGPWSAQPEGELWNATGFSGAELSYAELVAADDAGALALEFIERRFSALDS